MYELVIIGGGPAGIAAGVYAARKKIKSVLITEGFGGQSLVSADVQNWIGTKAVSGLELANMLEEHLRAQEGIEIIEGDIVKEVSKDGKKFTIQTKEGKTLETQTILVTAGSRRRKLDVPGEAAHEGKGVAYCATCDAPIFKDKIVAVVGGGNAGLEAVIDLLSYASKVYLLQRGEELKGDPTTQEKIKNHEKVEVIMNADTKEVIGDTFVTGLKYEDAKTGELKELKLEGVFVEIGAIPNSDFVADLVERNKFGEIIVDHKTQRSSLEGIWAAGDVSDVIYKQNNISAGDAIKAVLNIYDYLNSKKPH